MKRLGDLARDRGKPLRTLVNAGERAAIEARAREAGLTVSAFLRAAATGAARPRPSGLNRGAVDALAKVNADQARLGNLLKLYLQDAHPDHAAARRLIGDIQAAQADLKEAVKRLQA